MLGELIGWFIGWDLLLEYTAIVAVVAIGISGYFGFLVGRSASTCPYWMLGAPGSGNGHRGSFRGAVVPTHRVSAQPRHPQRRAVRDIRRGLKVVVVLLVIVVGVFYVKTANYTPFFPFGVGGAITGAATVFFAVFGYDAMSTAAEESRDARRHMPKAIIYSLAISMVLYVLATLVLTGMQNYRDIDPKSGFSSAFASVGLSGLAERHRGRRDRGHPDRDVHVHARCHPGVVLDEPGRTATAVVCKSHPVRRVPTRVTWIVGVASGLIAGFLPIRQAAELTNIGILVAFVVVCVAVIMMRYRQPNLPRAFRTPGMPVVPAIGVIFSIWLITFLTPVTWLRFLVWLMLGLIVYFAYSRRHSALNR